MQILKAKHVVALCLRWRCFFARCILSSCRAHTEASFLFASCACACICMCCTQARAHTHGDVARSPIRCAAARPRLSAPHSLAGNTRTRARARVLKTDKCSRHHTVWAGNRPAINFARRRRSARARDKQRARPFDTRTSVLGAECFFLFTQAINIISVLAFLQPAPLLDACYRCEQQQQ